MKPLILNSAFLTLGSHIHNIGLGYSDNESYDL